MNWTYYLAFPFIFLLGKNFNPILHLFGIYRYNQFTHETHIFADKNYICLGSIIEDNKILTADTTEYLKKYNADVTQLKYGDSVHNTDVFKDFKLKALGQDKNEMLKISIGITHSKVFERKISVWNEVTNGKIINGSAITRNPLTGTLPAFKKSYTFISDPNRPNVLLVKTEDPLLCGTSLVDMDLIIAIYYKHENIDNEMFAVFIKTTSQILDNAKDLDEVQNEDEPKKDEVKKDAPEKEEVTKDGSKTDESTKAEASKKEE